MNAPTRRRTACTRPAAADRRHSGPFLCATALSALLAGALPAATPAQLQIQGKVTEQGGQPLRSSALLLLQRRQGEQLVGAAIAEVTPEQPDFAFSGLPPGTYHLYNLPGSTAGLHASEVYQGRHCASALCTPEEVRAGTPLRVGTSGTLDVAFDLDPAATISGCVQAAGAPARGVVVVATLYDPHRGAVMPHDGLALTDRNGCYRIDSIRPQGGANAYTVRTWNDRGWLDQVHAGVPCAGGACDLALGTRLQVGHGQHLRGIDFELGDGAAIGGLLADAGTGLPLADTELALYDHDGQPVRQEFPGLWRTHPDGSFQSFGLADGRYYLVATVAEGTLAGRHLYGHGLVPAGQPLEVRRGLPIVVAGAADPRPLRFVLGGD